MKKVDASHLRGLLSTMQPPRGSTPEPQPDTLNFSIPLHYRSMSSNRTSERTLINSAVERHRASGQITVAQTGLLL